ncbi:spliceosome factor [Cryptosporidium ryanae]|uniref:spliceosome factor n=1 Tax=Cryptosporidium ryanae TaxID=515981 RepID=UPI00351A1054|nr:spliceosome factor [Cryptosporidium ryanae]
MPCFYSLTLESQGSILSAIHGSYSAPKAHEIVANRGRYLELLRFDVTLGQTYSICSTDTFSLIRGISNLRVLGSGRDLVVVTSDSGNIVILCFNNEKNLFERLHSEPYGKSGCRRIIPGHYLAVDPMGRSIMIAAVERQKLIYTLTRKSKDAETLDISSPMEAHKSHMICFSITALDVGYENPLFATIEQSYSDDKGEVETKKQLIYWEVDLGLNYVLRKASQEISSTSHLLLSVPGSSDGPGGVLICDNIGITYCKLGCSNIFCPFPIRFGEVNESGIMIVASALHKLKGFFFILLQTELGDIYRVHFSHDEGIVREIKIFYYDTIPVSNSLLVLRAGYLFAAHEFGNHSNYQFISLGDDDTDPFTSSLDDENKCVFFRLRNCSCIKKIEELPSLSPITDLKVLDINNDGCPQIVTSCGRGPRSTLRICSYGKNVEEITKNPLPGRPRFIWTLKKWLSNSSNDSSNENYHSYIIISFIDRSLVLSIGEHVEETTDTLFVLGEATIHAASMIFYNSFIQVLESHVRYINNDFVFDWKTSDNRKIVAGDSNGRQVALGLEGGLIVILELGISVTSGVKQSSSMGGNCLIEVCRREITSEIICIGLQQLYFSDQLRSNFVAVGTSAENTVRLYLISASEKRLKQTCVQALPTTNSIPESVVLYHSQNKDNLYLFIGLTTGVILTCSLDQSKGTIDSYRSKYLGTRGVHISRFIKEDNDVTGSSDSVTGNIGVMCLTNKPWIVDFQSNRIKYTPLQYKAVDSIAPLKTQQISNGYVAVSGSTLIIFQLVHNYGESFSQNIVKLNYTPRKILVLPPPQLFTGLETLIASGTLDIPKNQMMAVIETDHNTFDFKTKKEIISELSKLYNCKREDDFKNDSEKMDDDEGKDDEDVSMEIAQKDEDVKNKPENHSELEACIPGEDGCLIPESEVSGFVAGDGKWGGCIRIINLRATENQQIIHLDINEGCISSCVCKFDEMDLPCLVLGTVYGMNLRSNYESGQDSPFGAAIKVYRYDSNYNFELVHSTPVDGAVTAMTGWRGRLIVGIGKNLRVYSLGKKKLLRKSEYRDIPEFLCWIKVANDRIYAGDVASGILVFKYNQLSNQFSIIAKEPFSRWITSACEVLDYHTVITSDKFDNITVSRVPIEASDENSFTSSFIDSTYANTSSSVKSYQTNYIAQFHTGDITTCFQKTQLSASAVETIIYGTILGSIGSLTPITNNEDVELLTKLETLIRREKNTLLSRDQLMFRSYYSPVHNVIDGDFCQTFSALPQESQKKISSKLDVTVEEVYKKLDDMRARILW